MPNKYIDFLLGMLEELENLIGFDVSLSRNEKDRSDRLLKALREVLEDA